jgi:hypothetical protein
MEVLSEKKNTYHIHTEEHQEIIKGRKQWSNIIKVLEEKQSI